MTSTIQVLRGTLIRHRYFSTHACCHVMAIFSHIFLLWLRYKLHSSLMFMKEMDQYVVEFCFTYRVLLNICFCVAFIRDKSSAVLSNQLLLFNVSLSSQSQKDKCGINHHTQVQSQKACMKTMHSIKQISPWNQLLHIKH